MFRIYNTLKYTALGTALTLCTSYMPANENDKNMLLMRVVTEGLTSGHYAPKKIDDKFSKSLYDFYLKHIDNNKQFFTKKDLEELKKYEEQIDDQINSGAYQFFDTSYDLLNKKIDLVAGFYKEILAKPFDFSKNDYFEADDEKLDFAKNDKDLRERWEGLLKYQTLQNLVSAMETDEKKAKDSAGYKAKTFEVLESEARKSIEKSYTEWFANLKKLEKADRLSVYMNSITAMYDPHTTYYAPSNKQAFDIEMSGQFEGIGATLQEREGSIKVSEIVVGSASWREGSLKAGDVIIKVAQDGKAPVDVSGMRLDKVVQQIRGKKGTKVILTVKKPNGETQDIAITRDVVILEEKYAKSAILEHPTTNKKLGYINLPGFYADFNNKGGRSCSEDVKKELAKLKAEGINDVILDLRNNGGGSLQDVVNMMGLFIEKGPVVQVKGRDTSPMVLEDRDSRVQFDGNLVVMVNEFSASASEILAAAVQDYKRGVVIGSNTFGKGTVQRILDLDAFLPDEYKDVKPLGALTLTLQKFYRVNGGSTQLKGVTPDVVLNDIYSYLPLGEKDQDYALAWDEIPALPVKSWLSVEKLNQVKANSQARVQTNPTFAMINKMALHMKEERENSKVPLSLEKFKADKKTDREESKQLEDAQKKVAAIKAYNLAADQSQNEASPEKKERADKFYKGLQQDVYLQEAMNVLLDLGQQKDVVKTDK